MQTLKGGGAETLVRELVPRLRQRGIDANALCAYDSRLDAVERESIGGHILEAKKREGFDAGFILRMRGIIARERPDIVHTHTITGKYWGRIAAVAAGVPHIVHTEHCPKPQIRFVEHLVTRPLVRFTETYVTFSERNAAFVRRREITPHLTIIPNGIALSPSPTELQRAAARIKLGGNPEELRVGIVGSLVPKKNPELALRALALVPENLRNTIRLDFLGVGGLADPLRRLAQELGLLERVSFHGFRSDVRELLPGLDLLLTVAFIEAAPISLLEAMAAAIPIVGTPHDGTLDMVVDDQTGIITRDWSASAVAEALMRAVRDRQWRLSAGVAGRSRSERYFDIEKVADRHAELYRSLVNNEPRLASTA